MAPPPPPSCVLLPLDGCFAVCSTISLALLLFLSKRSPGGLLDTALPRVWKRILPLPTELEATRDLPSWTRPGQDLGSRAPAHEAVLDQEEGTTGQEEEPWLRPSLWKESGCSATTIRKLLCDNASCVLCARAAREAERVVHIQRLNPGNLVLRKPSLPTTSYVERSSLPVIAALQEDPVFSQSRSEPPEVGHPRHSPAASPLLRKRQRLPRDGPQREGPLPSHWPGPDTSPKRVRRRRGPHLQRASRGKDDFHTVDEQEVKEDVSSSSSTSEPPYPSGVGYDHFSAVSTIYSQKDHTFWGHQETFHHHEEDGSSSSEKEASSNSEGEDQRGPGLLSEDEQDFLTATLTSAGSSSSQKVLFVAIELPFVPEAVLGTLEQHLVVKRMQNAIGLPVILLRSLKAFLPFAPSPLIWWPLKKEVVVVTRPQVLPFESVATRRRLEQHVSKRAHLKHWGLPRKIQEALRHMKADFHPAAPGEERPRGEKPPSSIKCPDLASPTRDATLDDLLHSKSRFRVHIGKKLFQIAQEAWPKRVKESQKVSTSEEKKITLPKLIKLFWRSPQARGGPSLGLRRKADSVEMNIKCKHIQLLWQLPTFYSQSVSKMAPFNLPMTPPQGFRPSEFGQAGTPFLPSFQRQLLDSHVLRKKVQHQWGQPRLVQQSLRQFLSAAPFSPATPKGLPVDINVAPRSTSPFVPLEVNRKLEDHLKRKVIERQWGVPHRVMTSFQMFMPMPPSVAKMARESEREKVEKKSPSMKDPGVHKLPQALLKHMAQKALEIHLGGAGPFPTLLQAASLQDRGDALPRVISPGSRTLQLRPKELPFMEMVALERVELSIRHKDLAHKWGLVTMYQKSLSRLFTGVEFQVPPPPLPRRSLGLSICSSDTVFLSQGTREDLEWHVRRKKMQHTWGLARLVQKSLQLFLPAAPHRHAAGHTEVTTLPAEITFLEDATLHELERNVRKRVVLQRWHLPRRLGEPVKMLGSARAAVSGPSQQMEKPRRAAVSFPRQPEVFHLPPQGKALKEVKISLEKKHMEILLGVMPTVARSSWQHATFTPRQPLPKLIPPGRSFLQPRSCFLPFERPEDVVQIEQTLTHQRLTFLWGLTTRYLEALEGMVPRPPGQPLQLRLADRWVFSEVKATFLQEDVRGAFEGHVRRKRLQHEWGLPDTIQGSLRGFMGGAPSQLPQQSVTEVQVLHEDVTFLSQDSSRVLEHHLHRRKLQHQWGLPKRVLDAMKGLAAESIVGPPQPKEMQKVDQRQVGLGPSEAVDTNEEKAPQPPSPGQVTPPETLFFRGEAENRIQILFLRKCVEVHTGVFPGVARQSWQRLPPSRAPLPKPAPPSSWTPQPRRKFLPFVPDEDTGRLELTVLCHRLTSLWGLARVYVGGVSALQPKLSCSQPRPRGEELSEEQALSLQVEVREALELHIRKKRLEHGWGFPRLIQKSLQGFMERAPAQPSLQKRDSCACILCQVPDFLPPSTCAHLESHIQRRYLQRQWHLPAKALESLKLLHPQLELSPSDSRSSEDGDIVPYCCGQGPVSEQPTLGFGYFQPGGDMGATGSVEGTPQQTEVLSKIDSKNLNQLQIYLGKKNVELQLEAIPNIADLAWTQSSSRQGLPKQIPPGLRTRQPRSSSLSFFRAGEMERIEMAIRCNHLISVWSLGMRYVEVLSALPFRPFPKPFRLRRTSIEFSEVQTSFLQEQDRQGLENHVVKKKIHHAWGFPVLVQKSVKAFMQELPMPPTPQRNLIDVRVIHQEPTFLPQVVSSHLEFHVHKMNFQRQWGLPRRALKALWMLCPAGEDAEVEAPLRSHLDQTWRNFPRGLETVSESWPGGEQSRERDLRTKRDVLDTLDLPDLRRLQLHLAKKHLEIRHGVLPTIAKASLQLGDLYSKQPLPKLILSGQGLLQPRDLSQLTAFPLDKGHLEWVVQRNHFAFLWGVGLRYREALAGMMPKFTSPFPRHRLAQVDFSGTQEFFLQMEDTEVLEDHIKKKRMQHMWSCPVLVQRSVECFMSAAPLCPSTHKLETNTRILLREVHFLPPNTQTHLEYHIQRRKLLQRWKLPQKIQKSVKIFLPRALMEAPKGLLEWKPPPPEPLPEGASSVPSSRPTKQQTFRFQEVETPYLHDEEKEGLEYHTKKKRLQHQWGLPAVILRSLQAFAPSPLGPVLRPKKAGQDVKVQVQRPLFLPLHSQENLEGSLKRMITRQQWRLPKKVHYALRALSSATLVRRPQANQKKTGPDHVAKKDHLKKHLQRKSTEISFQSRTVPDILLPESLYSERGPISTAQPPGSTSAINGEGPHQRTSQAEAKDLLEFHILHKKICHEWGLPRIVQKSLLAFCPPLPKPRAGQGSVGEHLETTKEEGATTEETILQEDEMKLLAESPGTTKEVSEAPQDSRKGGTEATETETLTLAGGMPESSDEIISTGGKSQEKKEESHRPSQDAEKENGFTSKTPQQPTKTSPDVGSPQSLTTATANPQSPQASEEATTTSERPEAIEDESPEALKGTTILSKDLQAAEGAKVAGLQIDDSVAKGPTGPENETTSFETPQAAEERGAVQTTLGGDAAAGNGRDSPGTGSLQMEEEGIHGAAEEEGFTVHGLQVGPEDAASDSLHATEEPTEELRINSPQSAEETSITSKGSQATEGVVEPQSTEEPPGEGGTQGGSGSCQVTGRLSPIVKSPKAEEGSTVHGLQVGPEDAALDSLHATKEPTQPINSPQSAEETSITSKGSQATEGVVERPQATEEMARDNTLPQDEEDNENMTSPESETTRSPISEISLPAEGERAMTESTEGGKAKDAAVPAATEESDFSGRQHGGKSQSIKDMSLAGGRRPSTAVNMEANVPDQTLPTIEGGVSPHAPLEGTPSGSLVPEALEEANARDKAARSPALFAEEERRPSELHPQWVTATERPPGEGGTQGGSGSCQVTGRLGPMAERPPEVEGSTVHAGPEDTASDSLHATEEPTEESRINSPQSAEETSITSKGSQATEGVVEPQSTEGPPGGEGGTQGGSGSCRVTGKLSPMAERPPAAKRKRKDGKTWVRGTMGHTATPFGGEAPEQTQESFRGFLPQSRFHSYHKSTRVHFLIEAEPDSRSHPQKSPLTYRSEVRLQLEPGGRIGSWVSTEEPSRSPSPNPLPGTEASSSQEIEPEEGKARPPSPKGRPSSRDKPELTVSHVLLLQGTPKQDWLAFSEPEDYRSPSPLPPPSGCDKYDASRGDSQASDTSEFFSREADAESMPSTSIELLLWDKESFLRQLECSMRGMGRRSASPSGLRPPGMQPLTCSPHECGATVREREEGQEQRKEASRMARDAGTTSMASLEDNETQNETEMKKAHHAGSIVQGHLPEQENLRKPSKVATNPLLRSHVVQRALGSFILPACVISSYSTCEDVEVGLIRQAGRKHRWRLRGQLVEEKPVLGKDSESPPGYGVGGERPPPRPATPRTGEPKEWAHRDLRRPPAPPPSPNLSTTTLDQQDHEGSQITGEASSEGSDVSKLSSQRFSAVSSLEAGSELPAPPSDWLRSETGAESGYEYSSSLLLRGVPQPPQQQTTPQNLTSLEDQSQFSTECEWDRVGDWATEDMNSESLTTEEESSHLPTEERPSEGSSLQAEASSRPQSASSSSRRDKRKALSLVGSILERKLSLKQGMDFWLHSQGCQLTTRTGEKRRGVPREEQAAEGRAGFSGAIECALEGDAAERWRDPHPALQNREDSSRVGGTRVSRRRKSLAGRPGSRHRGNTSAGSFSTHCQASGSSSEDYAQEKIWGPEGALAWDRPGLKTSTPVARKRRTPKTQGLERAAKWGAGGRTRGPSRRKTRPVERDLGPSGREDSSSSSREERASPGSEGQPAPLAQGPAKTREGRLGRRREEPPVLGRTTYQPLPQAEQDDKAGQPTTWRSPQSREGSPEGALLRLSPQGGQAAGREGPPLGGPPGDCGVSEAPGPPGRPTRPLPQGDQFPSLKERIRLRRKELWSSPESQDEKPG